VEGPSDLLNDGSVRGRVRMKRPLLVKVRRRLMLVLMLSRLRASFNFRALTSIAGFGAPLGAWLADAGPVAALSNGAVSGAELDEPRGTIAAVALKLTASAMMGPMCMRPSTSSSVGSRICASFHCLPGPSRADGPSNTT
jgi:hypothetical protein